MAFGTAGRAVLALCVSLLAAIAHAQDGQGDVGLVVPCPGGQHRGDKNFEMCDLMACNNKLTDPFHCGVCGNECASGLVCVKGKCGKKPPPPKPAYCYNGSKCPGGTYCSGKPKFRCLPRKKTYAKCSSNVECRTLRCGCGLCRPKVWCVAPAHCGPGKYCQQPSCKAAAKLGAIATCRSRRKRGGACVSNAMCNSGKCVSRRCA